MPKGQLCANKLLNPLQLFSFPLRTCFSSARAKQTEHTGSYTKAEEFKRRVFTTDKV